MYVRGAKNREEVWLLDRLDELGLHDPAFRSRDYVIALDEETGERAGFGRYRVHRDGDVCEFAAIGVLEDWREQGVGAHVLERLVELASDQGFERAYAFTGEGGYLAQFGFERVPEAELAPVLAERLAEVREHEDPDAVPMVLAFEDFEFPRRLRDRFKRAGDDHEPSEPEESPEDFGIDPDEATYKYDTGSG
ncbi:MAG: GNAT family N-acetyltransferase [Halobacteriaceae archaeon]